MNLVKGYTQIGVQFKQVNIDSPIKLNDLKFDGLVGYNWEEGLVGDIVTIWNPDMQGYPVSYCWASDDPFELGLGNNVWFDESSLTTADITIPVGGTIFVKSANGGTVTFSK